MNASLRTQLLPTFLRITAGASLAVALCAARPGAAVAQAAALPEPPQGPAADASRALARGKAYEATRLLAPLLALPGPRPPDLTLLAARAAAGWDGWASVVRLLTGEPWLDQLEGGEGRALLARARLERGEDAALDEAHASVRSAPPEALGPRLITLGRALDRGDQRDSAAAVYRHAAMLLPAIADWLRLRAAGLTADSAERAAVYRLVTLPAALPRIRWTEALARDRTGDPVGAARVYEALGATLAAVRLRLKAATDAATESAVRRELVGLLTPRLAAEDTRDAIALFDRTFTPLTRNEELLVARRASSVDRLPRAAEGFARAVRSKPLGEADRLTYGTVLARLGRHREAMAMFASVTGRALHPQAEYLRARSLLAVGRHAAGLAVLRRVAVAFRYDTSTAATAGLLTAQLLVEDGDAPGARKTFLDVATRFPRTSQGVRAAFQAALIAFLAGDAKTATAEFGGLAERGVDVSERAAASYWAGRALLADGDSTEARQRWRGLLERFPTSYYAGAAAGRLGFPVVMAPPPGSPVEPDTGALAALDRGALLERLGLRVEARFEYDQLARSAESSTAALLRTAVAFASRGQVARAYRLALRAGEHGAAPDATLQRLLFPLPRATELADEAAKTGIDPLLAAAIIRQESAFDPLARSRADARGLMQVVPSLGASLARAEGIRDWDPVLLYQPEVNLHFGLLHLAEMLRRFPHIEPALASYNAGSRPANQWLALPGAAADPEVYIERIQYVETRDYVRRVLRNLAVYRVLYPTGP